MNGKLTKLFLAAAAVLLSGCGRAPAVDVFGSFFPVWMVCLSVAIVLTFGVRSVLVRTHIEAEVGPVALFYPCVVVLITSLTWLVFFQ